MRISGGKAGGLLLKVPKTIRPTQDMVRQAVFSMLAAALPGKKFLDLFSGTGAVGLEAWSRGDCDVTCVEADRKVFQSLQENIEKIAKGGVKAVNSSVEIYLKRIAGGERFDFIYADPPYKSEENKDWLPVLLAMVESAGILAEEGIFIMEKRDERADVYEPEKWKVISNRRYGQTNVICFIRKG